MNPTNKKKEGNMAFSKTGDAPIEKVFCSCGGEIDKETKKCSKCGKIPETKTKETKE